MIARAREISLALAVVAAAPRVARADDPAAATAYNQAVALEGQGKWPEACALYETSYHDDPQLGVLLHLAICHEHVGRTATAWSEFTDAADLARTRGDPREKIARKRADDLAPLLPKLYLAAPSAVPPGMIVRRDGVDVTALIGAQMPVDPGDHEIAVTAPGYVDWKTKVTAAASTVTPLDLPALQKAPEPIAPPPRAHEGTLVVTTAADAQISIDQQAVGTGRYEAKLKSGGHTLRVTAPGMRPYQSEIVVGDDEQRSIDVPLERVAIAAQAGVEPGDDRSTGEAGVDLEYGAKLRREDPAVRAIRGELSFHRGRRVDLGIFVEGGTISTSNACGFDMPGAEPATAYDYGPRNRFTRCTWLMPGVHLYVHVLPGRAIDPYLGLAPGFRFGFTDYTPYVGGVAQAAQSEMFPAIVVGVRAGVDYHPLERFTALVVGAFVEASITAFGEEQPSSENGNGQTFVSLLGGLRSTVAF